MLMTAEKLDDVPGMQALSEPQPAASSEIELRWFVLFAEPSSEWKAAKHLRRQGFNPWIPIERKTVYRAVRTMLGTRRRELKVDRPLFPGYVLIPLNWAWSFGPIYSTPGLRQNGHPFLMINGRYAVLPGHEVEVVRKLEYAIAHPEAPILPFTVGDRVRVVEGPFMDCVAKISRLDDSARIELLMDLLGRKTKFFAAARQIVAA